jgi:anti-anti-sigma regulatory factor
MNLPTSLFHMDRDAEVMLLTLAHPVGSLSDSVVMTELRTVLAELDRPEYQHVVVNFAAVDYFGSSLLESLRLIWNRIHPRGGKMALANVAEVGREILTVVKFDQLWSMHPSIPAAVQSVRA